MVILKERFVLFCLHIRHLQNDRYRFSHADCFLPAVKNYKDLHSKQLDVSDAITCHSCNKIFRTKRSFLVRMINKYEKKLKRYTNLG